VNQDEKHYVMPDSLFKIASRTRPQG